MRLPNGGIGSFVKSSLLAEISNLLEKSSSLLLLENKPIIAPKPIPPLATLEIVFLTPLPAGSFSPFKFFVSTLINFKNLSKSFLLLNLNEDIGDF